MSSPRKSERPDEHRQFSGGESHHPGFGLWETVESLRSEFDRRIGPRMGRGDVRSAIVSLLAEGPMHGYQIIQEIGRRTGGAWKPSPGSVYPTLQLLADEGVILAQESDGRKTYSLTETGAAEAAAGGPAPWESSTRWGGPKSAVLPKAGVKLAQVIGQVAREGTTAQVDEAVAIIDDARRKLHAILAKE